jgi:hypothetical protein
MASILSNTQAGTTLLSTDPVDSPLHPSNIFSVDGLVVLITGGGTGGFMIIITSPAVVEVTEFRLTVYRYWAYDGYCT